MNDTSVLILLVGAMLARAGQVLIGFGGGRARFAAANAIRVLLDLGVAIVSLVIMRRVGLLKVEPESMAMPLAGVLVAGGFLPSIIGERATTRMVIATSAVFSGLVVPLSWLMTAQLIDRGFMDEGGASIFALSAGMVGVVAAVLVGPREGRFQRDGSISVLPAHQMALTLGGFVLYATGFIAVETAMAGSGVIRRPFELITALGIGLLVSAAYTRWRFGRLDGLLLIPGGLGALTAASVGLPMGPFSDLWSLGLGAAGGLAGTWMVLWLERKLKVDDLPGVAGAQISGAIIGLVAAPIAAKIWRFDVYITQLLGAALFALIGLSIAAVALGLLKRFTHVRVTEAVEYDGLDLATLDVNAYPDFSQPMIRSSHNREV